MKSLIEFFSNLTMGKKLLLLTAPIISVIISMKTAIFGLWLLIFFDLLTGIRKSLHIKGISFNPFKIVFWRAIKSYLLRQTWRKTYEYGLGIIIIIIFESLILGATPIGLIGKTFTIAELSVLIPSAVEVWSIFENFEAVSGKNILKRIKEFLPPTLAKLFKSSKNG
jgi:hypothetical protein